MCNGGPLNCSNRESGAQYSRYTPQRRMGGAAPGEWMDARLQLLTRWVKQDLGLAGADIQPASADASFRRYFRVRQAGRTCIVMDAPPDREDVAPFLRVARILGEAGVNAPRVLEQDLQRGFLMLTDLGSEQYLGALEAARSCGDSARIRALYDDALACLLCMQRDARTAAAGLAAYDRGMLVREMDLLPEWFLERHLGLAVDAGVRAMLDQTWEVLVASADEQPASFVHRDYHSRNLMVCDPGAPGILDFQDAVCGPVTYDLVSLLKDCYIAWPAPQVRNWVLDFRRRRVEAGMPAGRDEAQFIGWFDLMGLQRHIKVLGIFARLWYRDGKPGYLKDLPLVLHYARETARAWPQVAAFSEFIEREVVPRFAEARARASAHP